MDYILKSDLPEGISGDWEIKKYSVSKHDAEIFNIRGAFSSMGHYSIQPGNYIKLTYKDDVVMSDTPNELSSHRMFVWDAKGRLLIVGLGLGIVLRAVLDKKKVSHVTVIEKSEDVIKLVAPRFENDIKYKNKVKIIHADIFEWKPEKLEKFDYAWFDIWNDVCITNIEEINKLHRKFRRCCGKVDSWKAGELRYLRERQRRAGW